MLTNPLVSSQIGPFIATPVRFGKTSYSVKPSVGCTYYSDYVSSQMPTNTVKRRYKMYKYIIRLYIGEREEPRAGLSWDNKYRKRTTPK